MSLIVIYTIKLLRKIYAIIFLTQRKAQMAFHNDANEVAKIIFEKLLDDKPCMIARYGAFELSTIVNYIGVKSERKKLIAVVKNTEPIWWWEKNNLYHLQNNAGFYPLKVDSINSFCELMIKDSLEVDILGSWQTNEYFVSHLLTNSEKVHLQHLEPFWSDTPWTSSLKGKKILVIHPFKKSILSQYKKRSKLFSNNLVLPEFASLQVIKAVQSIDRDTSGYSNWFNALEGMKKEIDKADFDICLIGAGAYGFPLAAHVKRMGKKAVHLGGSLQLLFGIRGKRWEDENYGVKAWGLSPGSYSSMMNEYWVSPMEEEAPRNAKNVENGCYW